MGTKTSNRRINIFLNGKAVTGTIKEVRKEFKQLKNEIANAKFGTVDYEKKAKRLQELKSIMNQHRDNVNGISKAWKQNNQIVQQFIGFAAAKFTAEAVFRMGQEILATATNMDVLSRKSKVVFAESLPLITKAAEDNAKAMGLANGEYVNQATLIGDLLVPMGFARRESADFSIQLLNLAGAASEWTGGQVKTTEATEIFRKAILGEREALERLGIKIDEELIKQRLKEKNLTSLTGEYLRQAKALATLELITEQTTDAQTSFANSSDSLARKQAEITATVVEIKEKLVALLIPAIQTLINIAAQFVGSLSGIAEGFYAIFQPVEAATQAYKDQKSTVIDLESNLHPLINRYEELKEKGIENEKEQKELDSIIAQIAETVPTAITQFDRYGNALDISTDKAREFIDAQKLLLKQKNREVIDENASALENYQSKLNRVLEALNRKDADGDLFRVETSIRKSFGELETFNKEVKLGAGEIRNLQEEAKTLQKNITDTTNAISILTGELNSANVQKPEAPIELSPTRDEILAAADRAEKRRKLQEKLRKEREKAAAREAKALQRKFERLQTIVDQYTEKFRLSQLEENERALEEIRLKYDKEIADAKELEAKGFEEATAQRLELEELREAELQAKREELQEKRLEKMREFQEQLDAELGTELENELTKLDQHYDELITKAEEYNIDLTGIIAKYYEEQDRIRKKFRDKEEKEAIKKKQDAIKREDDIFQAQKDIQFARLALFQTVSQQLSAIAGENATLQNALFAFEKGLAAAQLVVNLQKQISAINTKYALIPGGPALAIAEIVRAKISTGIGLTTIAGATLAKFAQKKEGGWFNATGQDDHLNYRAQYIGHPGTGMLPDHPVLVATSSGTPVLGSERGREYFVANHDLKKPAVLNHVRAIQNITNAPSSFRQFADGGATDELPTATSFESGDGGISESTMVRLTQIMEGVAGLLERGVVARFENIYDEVEKIQDAIQDIQDTRGIE